MQITVMRHARVVHLIAIAVLVVIFLLSSIVIAFYFFATPDKIRAALIPVIEDRLNCEVELAHIDVNLLSGVKLSSLSFSAKDETAPWFQVDKAVLRYRILPLLRGRVVIDELRLDAPRIVTQRNADGSIRIGTLMGQNVVRELASSTLWDEDQQVGFRISSISIANAEILLRDFTFGAIPRLTRLQGVGLQMKDFAPDAIWRFTLWGKLNGTPLDIEGVLDPQSDSGSLNLMLEHLNLVAFQPYYRENLPFRVNRMEISTDCRIDFTPDGLHIKGDLFLAKPDIFPVDVFAPEAAGFSATELKASLELKWKHSSRQLSVLDADGVLDGLEFGVKGSADFNGNHPVYALDVVLLKWPVRVASTYTSLPLLKSLEQHSPAGMCTAVFSWRREAKSTHGSIHSARITLADAGVSLGRLRFGLSGAIELHGEKLSAPDLNGKVAGHNVRLSLHSNNWRALHPRFELKMQGTILENDSLFAEDASSINRRLASKAVGASSTFEPGPYAIPFDLNGRFEFKVLRFKALELQGVTGEITLVDNVLNLEHVQAGFASGGLRGTFRLDMRRQGFTYDGKLAVAQLKMQRAVAALWPDFVGAIKGEANLSISFSGAGTQPIRVRQNLAADVGLSIENSFLKDINIQNALAQQFNIPSLAALNLVAASAEIGVKTGDRLKFNLLGRNETLRVEVKGESTWQGRTEGRLSLYLVPELARDLSPEHIRDATIDKNGLTLVECGFRGDIQSIEFPSGVR